MSPKKLALLSNIFPIPTIRDLLADEKSARGNLINSFCRISNK